MYLIIATLWLFWEVKYVLFWLYLWQLKDYHVGRFADHFRTHKGKKILLDVSRVIKLVLFVLFLALGSFFVYLLYILLLVYLAEFLMLLRSVINRSIKKPKKTFKILFLGAVSFAVVVLFLAEMLKFNSPALLLGFDILTPIVVSVIVLLFQPIFVLMRNHTLRKARDKMEKIKSLGGLKVIAITGSYGKTSTKEFLSAILSKKYKVLKTKEHQNSEIGIAKCILQELKPSHQIFIAEVGAYDKGKVKEVCSILKPKIGIVTGVNEQHLALFGSLKNLLSAEGGGELADSLSKDGLLVVNGDNKYCLDLYRKFNGNKRIYSLSNKIMNSDIWTEEMIVAKKFVSFIAVNRNKEMSHFTANVLGGHCVQNLLGAILIARELGMSFGEISVACGNIFEEQAGMTLKSGKYGINIVDSSYSANPDGVFADLDYLSVFQGKRLIVMPCLIELGKKSGEIHQKIGRKIGEICDLAVITSKDKFEEIKKGAIGAGMEDRDILLCDKPQDICSIITLSCKAGDVVLLEGRVPGELINLLTL
ncbi:MAG: Mur ligase family protein [Candidatus Staskawiczbacteria bacterium]|nr:Mur ligase family protein [Candidatus Staskawiczbacteria bacterium]